MAPKTRTSETVTDTSPAVTDPVSEAISNAQELTTRRLVSKDQLAEIASFDQAMRLAVETYGDIISSEEMGDGFSMVEDKRDLVGIPFLILDSSLKESDEYTRGGEKTMYTVLRIVTHDDRKLIVVDGSTGLKDQIVALWEKWDRRGGFFCRKGLTVSEYTYTAPNGDTSPAATFYIDESGS